MIEMFHPTAALATCILRTGDRAATARLTALALDDAEGATEALFGSVVEPLCDGFTRRGTLICEGVLAQVIDLARRHPDCAALDAALTEEGIGGEADLRARTAWGQRDPTSTGAPDRIGLISRGTLGADLAISLPLLRGLAARWPEAEIVVFGRERLRPVIEGLGARFVSVGYGRQGGLAARLGAWVGLREAIAAEAAGAGPGRWLLIDPDTRLTQLGLLAPGPRAAYWRLPSRKVEAGCLGQIARDWLAARFGAAAPTTPLPLRLADAAWARRLRSAMTADGRRLVAAGFGFGGNPAKRVGPEFEAGALVALVADGHRVLLARGVDGSARAATEAFYAALVDRGLRVRHLPEGRHLRPGAEADVVTWQADPGAFLAVIAASDAHLGYDSAGQHIAAALGVPTLTILVTAAGLRHADRWRPTGPGPIRVLRVDPGATGSAILGPAIAAMRALLRGGAARLL
ncbi:hypothetical protein [uncultured Jannaschia sp.]|uniref:glycosyltransferase family 9 protein n=1 Tax=uncultured Jannaschia sp. TaxID=293347 RepID=UPI002615841D|nr:hypothetical protein [uncultured Jannaschia sp.]